MFVTVTQLVTLPLRLVLRGARTLLQLVTGGAGAPEEWDAAAPVTPSPVRPRESAPREPTPREPAPRKPAPRKPAPPRPAAERSAARAAAVEAALGIEDHVSEEPVLVEEFADPGAEDGAGPEISIVEPWPAYGSMKANEVIARLEEAAPAEVAVARLYEQANRRRKTVLAAAERRLQALGA